MRIWLLLALLVGELALAKPKPKRKRPPTRRAPASQPAAARGPGQITFLTATTAYLDRGMVDGLAVGSALVITRAGRLVGRCTVDTVSEKWATCSAVGLKVGDRIGVDRELAPPPPALAAVPDPAQLQLRREQVEAAPIPLVEFTGGSGGLLSGGRRLVSIAASHTTWLNLAEASGPYHLQRIDLGLYDVQLWRGLHGSADLSVLNFSQRPAGHRSPLGSPALLVRQLELSFHTPAVPLIAQLGRTWTRHTPGLLMLDGAQVAWRNRDDSFELGAFGGLLPEPINLGFSTRRWTAGAFVMARFESGRGAKASLFQLEARLNFVARSLGMGRGELGAAARAWLGRSFDAHLQLELGVGDATAAGLVDAVRLALGWRPAETVRLYAQGRYQGTAASDALELGVAVPGGQRAIRGDAGLTIELSSLLWLGASGGVASDLASGLTQARAGPELTLPRLLGGTTSFTLGYQEELGWLRGRTAWAQLTLTPVSRLRILARGSWFHQQPTAEDEGIAGHELGAALMVDLAITSWLWVRATGLGRGQVGVTELEPGARLGGTVMGQLGGQL